MERRNAATPERRNTKTRNTKLLKPGTHENKEIKKINKWINQLNHNILQFKQENSPSIPAHSFPTPSTKKKLIIFDGKNVLQCYLSSTYDCNVFRKHLIFGDDPLFRDGKGFGNVSRQTVIMIVYLSKSHVVVKCGEMDASTR